MIDKVQKIREEVEKLHGNPYYMMAIKDALTIIDSSQEEPVSDTQTPVVFYGLTGSVGNTKEEPTIPEVVDEHYWEMLGEESLSDKTKKAIDELSNNVVNGLMKQLKDNLNEEAVSEDLDGAAKRYSDNEDPTCTCEECLLKSFKAGAKWQKEQMMEKAIRGRVSVEVESNYHSLIYGCWDMDNALKNCNDGSKVKIVIIKEG